MRLLQYIISAFFLVHVAVGLANVGVTTSTGSRTTVYVTKTKGGKVITTNSVFSQTFIKTYTQTKSGDVSSGKVGLGSHSTTLGHVRTYAKTTISNNNAQGSYGAASIYTSAVGLLFILTGLVL